MAFAVLQHLQENHCQSTGPNRVPIIAASTGPNLLPCALLCVFFLKTDHQLFQKANKVQVHSELGQPTALKKEREKKNSILDTANKEKANRTQPGNTKEK